MWDITPQSLSEFKGRPGASAVLRWDATCDAVVKKFGRAAHTALEKELSCVVSSTGGGFFTQSTSCNMTFEELAAAGANNFIVVREPSAMSLVEREQQRKMDEFARQLALLTDAWTEDLGNMATLTSRNEALASRQSHLKAKHTVLVSEYAVVATQLSTISGAHDKLAAEVVSTRAQLQQQRGAYLLVVIRHVLVNGADAIDKQLHQKPSGKIRHPPRLDPPAYTSNVKTKPQLSSHDLRRMYCTGPGTLRGNANLSMHASIPYADQIEAIYWLGTMSHKAWGGPQASASVGRIFCMIHGLDKMPAWP